ncbi:hypothetical protein COT86_01075 [Candidatus Collierbacteria bacterium CG10_big_fil_rev_8_21_14_0_10_43_36]|uniref:Uncharacterized protein n=2 Tax=Candidatus Collieribacteriota TaxID=1752725 RepID=A0A2H0VLJ5_9BACT|nr:hypothetical protein [bacterium]PIR99975.1 MAG: hypothetical protein COT86_01075 [Candidatus Collierbacteria bacterium CG10_big_fil_rev_8_21_14_0_10_43_36]PJB48401.1 MAG: hypothetical protein CO104_01360 [Candidatus Collierbacteria bacterium CG_4_9_14_3_um_filter_43_16]
MPLTQKDLDAQTEKLVKLIKSEVSGVEARLKKEIINSEKNMEGKFGKFEQNMNRRFEFQKQELESRLDDKFETNRRLLVNDMQNFQDKIITEIKSIKQETQVNSGHRRTLDDHEIRIQKVEKHLFSN